MADDEEELETNDDDDDVEDIDDVDDDDLDGDFDVDDFDDDDDGEFADGTAVGHLIGESPDGPAEAEITERAARVRGEPWCLTAEEEAELVGRDAVGPENEVARLH